MAFESISTYYTRYDVKYTKNRMSEDNLLMIPEKEDFRAEFFSAVTAKGAISSALTDSAGSIEQAIKNDALKSILKKHGLKSVSSKDHDTVVSYEGAIKTPLNITHKAYNNNHNQYDYEVQAMFAPTAFPDQWENLSIKHKIKGLLKDFFNFFY